MRKSSSELLMSGGSVSSILLLPNVDRCLEIIDVCIWSMFVSMSVVVTVLGSFSLGVLNMLYVCVWDMMDVVFSV